MLLITLDTLRADRLGCYGNPEPLTPNLDKLAESSILFERSVAPMGTTFPSHASMLTGLYPRVHGVRWNGDTLRGHRQTLAETLAEQGWKTAAFVAYKAMLFRGGLDQGFELVSDAKPPVHRDERIRAGRAVTDMALQWLSQTDRESPFFLWLHYFEPHGPYDPTPYSRSRLKDYDGPLAQGASLKLLNTSVGEILRSPRDLRALRTLYDGEVALTDSLVGEVLDFLGRRRLLNETLVWVVGDHGQALGEHGQHGHGPMLWEPVLHVPMMVRLPSSSRSQRIHDTVSLVDVFPTTLAVLGLESPARVQGKSLMPLWNGQRMRRPVFAEVRVKARDDDTEDRPLAVRLGAYKLILESTGSRLYDLSRDPEELAPLPQDQHEALIEQLTAAARRYASANATSSSVPLTDEDIEELRSLGYL